STFPSLRSSQRFLALRAKIGLDSFVRCFDETRAPYLVPPEQVPQLVRCRDDLEQFVRTSPVTIELARDAARLVRLKLSPGAAAPLYAIALATPGGELICAELDAMEVVVNALSRHPDQVETKAGLMLVEKCWEAVKTEVVAEVARRPVSHYYV